MLGCCRNLSLVLATTLGAVAAAQAAEPKVTVVRGAGSQTPLLVFEPLASDLGMPPGTWPSGLVPLPALPAFMPHPLTAGPPRAASAIVAEPSRAETALAAIARAVPLPRPRPSNLAVALAPAQEKLPVERPVPRSTVTDMTATTCKNVFALGYAVAVPRPPIEGPGACGASEVVDLAGVVLADGRRVAIDPPASLNCVMAEQIAKWLRDDLAPTAASIGHPFRTVRNAASYVCRGRNNNPRARLSEHGRANALDIRGFQTLGGDWLLVGSTLPPALQAQMKRGACERFMTVLGPGSDGFHEDHIHVDLATRSSDYRMCRWNLPGGAVVSSRPPPAPAPTASAAPPASPRPERAPTIPQPRTMPR